MQGRSALDAVAMAYAREVYIRNESQLQGLSHNLVITFHDASLKFVDKVSKADACSDCSFEVLRFCSIFGKRDSERGGKGARESEGE